MNLALAAIIIFVIIMVIIAVFSHKKSNSIILTMKGSDGTELFDIYDDTDKKILENVAVAKTPSEIKINSNTKFITIIFTNDNGVRDLKLEKINVNGNDIPLNTAIKAELNFNPTTNTDRYNAVLNGEFHWGLTKYKINLQ